MRIQLTSLNQTNLMTESDFEKEDSDEDFEQDVMDDLDDIQEG